MANQDQPLEELKQKYASVLRAVDQQQVRLQNLQVQDNKLLVRGEAPSQDAKNRVWDQIKLVNPQYDDITADITVAAGAVRAPAPSQQQSEAQTAQTYTVQAGDTLSAIAKRFFGSASEYMKIFEANRDVLSDPNRVQTGQQLKIPGR
jgi:nucleoid-associated protein YgaU